MASVADASRIERLGPRNYLVWSKRVKAFLTRKKCWAAIDPGFDDDEDLTPKEEEMNADALSYLTELVEDCYLNDVTRNERAKCAWNRLKSIHFKISPFQFVSTMDELANCTKKTDESVLEYLNRVEQLVEKLRNHGSNLNDQDLAAYMLRGLKQENYKQIAHVMELNEETLTSENVKSKLLLEEDRIEREKNDRERRNHELRSYVMKNKGKYFPNAERKGNYSENGPNRLNITCHCCGQPGHFARDCPKAKEAKARGNVICYICGKEGHPSFKCRNSESGASKGSTDDKRPRVDFKNKISTYEEEKEPQLEEKKIGKSVVNIKYAVHMMKGYNVEDRKVYSDTGDANVWIVDNGCNLHITPHRELFNDFTSKVGGSVQVGKKEVVCDVRGSGSVVLKISDDCGGWTLKLTKVLWVPDASDNILSVRQLEKTGVRYEIDNGKLVAFDKTKGDCSVFS